MPNAANSALAGLLTTDTAAPKPKAPTPPPEPEPPKLAAGLEPASNEQLARHSLPPGTLHIRVPRSDPSFESVAASAVAEGRQLIELGGETFAVAPPPPKPQGGLLAGAGPGAAPSAPAGAPRGGLLA